MSGRNTKHKKKQFRRRNGGSAKNVRSAVGVTRGQNLVLKQIGAVVPDSLVTNLMYVDETYSRTNNGSGGLGWRLRANSIYDPDPALGSGGLVGSTALFSLYAQYRVLAFEYQWQACNLEANPTMIFAYPSDVDVGANPTSGVQYAEGPYAKKAIMSAASGMDRAKLRGRYTIQQLVGSSTTLSSDSYAASTGANPSYLVFINFGAAGLNGPFTTKGISSALRVVYQVEFYNRKPLIA
jgi:hypothetical protein